MDILALPDEILDKILSYSTYDEVTHFRMVCKKFDSSAQRILNQGFYKAEKFHRECLRKVKEQLPRRESERRKHPLSAHCDILTAVDNRLSLLGMTYMKYVELKYCCFIPGKVLDEIFGILRIVSNLTATPRAHIFLQELRDLSSMAMDHFDENIAPAFKARSKSSQQLSVSSYGVIGDVDFESNYCSGEAFTSYDPSLPGNTEDLGIMDLYSAIKMNNGKIMELKRDTAEVKKKNAINRKKLNDVGRKVSEMENIISEQKSRITNLQVKSLDMVNKLTTHERITSQIQDLLQSFQEESFQRVLDIYTPPEEDEATTASASSDASECCEPPKKKVRFASPLLQQPKKKR